MTRAVQQMFDGVAPTYDALNRLLSLGLDQGWRRRAVAALGPLAGRRLLDVCAGTLDLSALCEAAGATVLASDFSQEMLSRGRGKLGAPLIRADALALPFADASFDALICGFGLRNLDDPARGLREMRRVLRPGGRCVILDFFRPRRTVSRAVQTLYNQQILPLVGGLISGDKEAYRYLARSIDRFSPREEIERLGYDAGFSAVRGEDLTLGIASLVVCSC